MERAATTPTRQFLVPYYSSRFGNRTRDRLQVSLRQWRRRAFPVILCTANRDLPSLSGDEPLEVLFMKELRKRGMSPKIVDDGEKNSFSTAGAEARTDSEGEDYMKSNMPRAEMRASSSWSDEQNTLDKREPSIDLHSKGVVGRILIASFLHCIGGSFSLMIWPLLLSGIAVFLALYIYFGENLAHPGMALRSSGLLIDPYQLLEEERAYLLRFGPITSSLL